MPPPRKHWKIFPKLPEAYLEQFSGPQRLVAQILHNRGLTTPEQVEQFLQYQWDQDDPFLLKDMDKAVERLIRAVDAAEPIIIYGDYDVDGVTSTAVLMQFLLSVGARVQPYIPHRFDEGYGLNNEALQYLFDQGARLILTVDCGIRAVAEVEFGNRLGLEFIITDHHSVGPEIPPALAVINPKQPDCPYPFKQLTGVGLAYKLTQALHATLSTRPGLADLLPAPETFLDLVALGTVADLGPLQFENRKLVAAGLQQMNQTLRPGLSALLETASGSRPAITSETIGFVLGPRLNAAGRLESAQAAYRLLMAWSEPQARPLAQKLDELNRERQRQTQEMVNLARQTIEQDEGRSPLYFISHPDFNAGVVGLAASRLVEEFYRPVLVAEQGPEFTKGSARSVAEFHITNALNQCRDLLVKYGGHSAAAGFTVRNEDVPRLVERLQEIAADTLDLDTLFPTIEIDAEISAAGLHLIDEAYMEALQSLEPFGVGNPQPIFLTRDLLVRQKQAVGQEGQHLKLVLDNGRRTWEAIGFRLGPRVTDLCFKQRLDLVYALEYNTWNGERRLQLNIKDFRICEE